MQQQEGGYGELLVKLEAFLFMAVVASWQPSFSILATTPPPLIPKNMGVCGVVQL